MNILEGAPTFIPVRRYKDGELAIDNVRAYATLEDAIYDLDDLVQVLMMEGDGTRAKVVDVSGHAAEIWWQNNGSDCDSVFDVPEFIHDNLRSVYAEISERKYDARCEQIHQQSLGPR